jgi:hypothetical protein
MKGFVSVTDNDLFAFGSLLKQFWPKVQGLRHKAIRSNWAKEKNVKGDKDIFVPEQSHY